ncbi:DUF3006 domain-containing protein, partial [Pseudomonas sp. 2822-17]|uniref:DUF3006 domain-containing protein n=1 Tax=Pseudomonas sp. 2822-17 TaxID=1712678 RepID=UPI000C633C41
MMQAVIDRIVEGKHAVVLIGEDEVEKIVPIELISDNVNEGDWIEIKIDNDGNIISIEQDTQSTKGTKQRVKNKMELLRKRSKRNK